MVHSDARFPLHERLLLCNCPHLPEDSDASDFSYGRSGGNCIHGGFKGATIVILTLELGRLKRDLCQGKAAFSWSNSFYILLFRSRKRLTPKFPILKSSSLKWTASSNIEIPHSQHRWMVSCFSTRYSAAQNPSCSSLLNCSSATHGISSSPWRLAQIF